MVMTLAVVCAIMCAISVIYVSHMMQKSHEAEVARLVYVCEKAMLIARPGSMTEKVQAETTKKSADLQLKILEDSLALEQERNKRVEEEVNPEPKWVSGFDKDGKAVDINLRDGWEIVE